MVKTIIEWDRQRIIDARGTAGPDRVSFESVSVIERTGGDADDSEQILRILRPLFPVVSGKTHPPAVLVFPRQSVTIHRIQLPLVPDHEVPDMVRLQAALRLTVPLETVCLDFVPLPAQPGSQTRDVLLITVPQEQIKTVQRILAACQVTLAEVRVSGFCIATAASSAGLLKPHGDPALVDALILLRRDFIEVTFVRGTSVVFSHSGASWTAEDGIERAVRSELNRARMTASESLGEYRIGRLLLIGSPDITAAVSDEIAARIDMTVPERIDPALAFLSGVVPQNVSATTLVAVAGAIARDRIKNVDGVDLLHPRKAPEKRDLRRAKILAVTLVAVLLFGLVWNWRQRQLTAFQAEADQLQAEIADRLDALKLGEPDAKLAELVGHWVDRDISWIDEMVAMQKHLPGTDRFIVRAFQFLRKDRDGIGTVRLEGKARTIEDVDAMARRLAQAGYQVGTPVRKASQRDPGYPIELTLQMTIPDGKPAAHAPQGMARK